MIDEHSELLELLETNGIEAWVQHSSRGPKLKVVSSYLLNDVSDYKALLNRLIEIRELGTLGL